MSTSVRVILVDMAEPVWTKLLATRASVITITQAHTVKLVSFIIPLFKYILLLLLLLLFM